MARVRRYAEEAGRDPSEVDFAYSAGLYNDREPVTHSDGSRLVFTDEPERVAEDIRAFDRLGVRHLLLGLQATGLEETLERMERFSVMVKPLTEG